MSEKGLIMVWYYHLPSISTNSEIKDLIRISLKPLLSSHRKYSKPVTLAITGSLLNRITEIDHETISLIESLISKELLELASTFYYEIFPPVVPYKFLKAHLEKDLSFKKELFGIRPSTFYPPNFSWVSILNELLPDLGIKNVILDEGHLKACFKIQMWKWEVSRIDEMKSILVDTYLDKKELHRIYTYKTQGDKRLRLFFRDFEVVKNLSFGNSGLFHKPFEWDGLKNYVSQVFSQLKQGDFITLADDGDRINPISLFNYSNFLRYFDKTAFFTPSLIDYNQIHTHKINYLPSYSIASLRNFWLKDLDSIHYLNLLNELYTLSIHRSESIDPVIDEIMELQDVYFLFWKTLGRKKYYMEKLYKILKLHSLHRSVFEQH
ncbi:hypothetical protein [Thermococcus sp.]|uniref:hypothetical protein n=1 Tax=Thermococcus sp. TaxID=35749 RepID=UPI0026227BBA|nr:hypothetical protein [Thermococcus sp.]